MRQQRPCSWQETQAHVREARRLTECYGLDEANAAVYLNQLTTAEQLDWDNLPDQIK